VVREEGVPLVLHDPLCPLTPVDFLAEAIEYAGAHTSVVVGVRPVTDTVKVVTGHGLQARLGDTLDRSELVEVTSPIVLPPAVVAGLAEIPVGDFADLVDRCCRRWPVTMLVAPAAGRRVHDREDLVVLDALVSR
jgi:2-C-methyl-D-erythritol 4-phosphate cytidylyltransferase